MKLSTIFQKQICFTILMCCMSPCYGESALLKHETSARQKTHTKNYKEIMCDFINSWPSTEDCQAIIDCCLETQSLITECCELTQSNIEELQATCDNILSALNNTCDVVHIITTPTIITVSGNYCLANNLTASSASPLISIQADDVALNLNNFNVNNSGSNAIDIGSIHNVSIMSGVISAASNVGINLDQTSNAEILDIDFEGCQVGINASMVMGLSLNQCTFYSGGQGLVCLYVAGSATNCYLVRNAAPLNKSIVDIRSSAMTFENIEVAYNTLSGTTSAVYLQAVQDAKWSNCRVNANTSDGIFAGTKVEDSIGTLFQNCEFNFNQSTGDNSVGLWIKSCPLTNIRNCNAHDTQGSSSAAIVAGFYLEACENSSLIDSAANNHRNDANNGVGIAVGSGVISTHVCHNTVIGNNTGICNNSTDMVFLQNFASASTVSNYVGVNPLVTLTKSTGMLSPTFAAGASSYDNVSAV